MTDVNHPHGNPYGFPAEWFWWQETGPDSGRGGVRAFAPPDFSRFPESALKDRPTFDRLVLSLRDFSHARSAITFIEQDIDYDERYPLAELRRFACYETTMIVSYCRPFSESQGGVPRLSFKQLGVKLSPFTKVLHDEVMAKRNQIFAHSDADHVPRSLPWVMKGKRYGDGELFTTLFPPTFHEGTMFDYPRVQQVSVLLSSLSHAVMMRLQAMHVHFLNELPSHDFRGDDENPH